MGEGGVGEGKTVGEREGGVGERENCGEEEVCGW